MLHDTGFCNKFLDMMPKILGYTGSKSKNRQMRYHFTIMKKTETHPLEKKKRKTLKITNIDEDAETL